MEHLVYSDESLNVLSKKEAKEVTPGNELLDEKVVLELEQLELNP